MARYHQNQLEYNNIKVNYVTSWSASACPVQIFGLSRRYLLREALAERQTSHIFFAKSMFDINKWGCSLRCMWGAFEPKYYYFQFMMPVIGSPFFNGPVGWGAFQVHLRCVWAYLKGHVLTIPVRVLRVQLVEVHLRCVWAYFQGMFTIPNFGPVGWGAFEVRLSLFERACSHYTRSCFKGPVGWGAFEVRLSLFSGHVHYTQFWSSWLRCIWGAFEPIWKGMFSLYPFVF